MLGDLIRRVFGASLGASYGDACTVEEARLVALEESMTELEDGLDRLRVQVSEFMDVNHIERVD